MNQDAFLFEGPLTAKPESQLHNVEHLRTHTSSENDDFVARLRAALVDLPDDIDLDAPLLAATDEPSLDDEALEAQRRAFSEGRVVYLNGILVDHEDHPT